MGALTGLRAAWRQVGATARRAGPGLALAAVAMLSAMPALAQCRDDVAELRGDWGQTRFAVEVADTDATRSRGLMFRESMARFAGMLFAFDEPGEAVFWMENTLIPLDMLFIGVDGRVNRIHHEARPLDRTAIEGGDGVLMVLEINGGMARRLGIDEGSELRHPRLDQELALWPCENPAEAGE